MGTEQEILFAKTIEQVKKLAREQGGKIGRDQVLEAFKGLELSQEQLDLIFEYLKKIKIGIDAPAEAEGGLSEEETDYLEEYRKELTALRRYSEGEKEAVTLSAMAGEKDAQQELICIYLPQVLELSKLYAGQGVFLEDLIGEGNMALAAGVTMLGCLEHAKEAEGMLIRMVMDAMEESIAENLEESEKNRKVLARVDKVAEKAKELAEDLQRKVTAEELAEETGMSEKAIREAMRISGYSIEDLER